MTASLTDAFAHLISALMSIPWWLVSGALVGGYLLYQLKHRAAAVGEPIIRGSRLLTLEEKAAEVAALTVAGQRFVAWGGIEIPFSKMHAHYAFLGTTRSGKSMSIQMLVRSVLVSDRQDAQGQRQLLHRGLFFDPKSDTYQMLLALGVPADRILWLNPFDARGCFWDIAQDVTDITSARTIGRLLAPADENATSDYWGNVTQALVGNVLWELRLQRGVKWTLLDVVKAFDSTATLKAALSRTEPGRIAFRSHIEENAPTTKGAIFSTIQTKIVELRIPAEFAAANPDMPRVSIGQWFRDGGQHKALLLCTVPKYEPALKAINSVLFTLAALEVLSRPEEHPKDETWFILDEPRAAGRQAKLEDLLGTGASKGVHVALSMLDSEGFEAVYPKGVGSSLRQLCGNVSINALANLATAQWAAQVLGKQEVLRKSYGRSRSVSQSKDGATTTEGESEDTRITERDLVLSNELMRLRPASADPLFMEGVYIMPDSNPWKGAAASDFLQKWWIRTQSLVLQPSIRPPDPEADTQGSAPPDTDKPDPNGGAGQAAPTQELDQPQARKKRPFRPRPEY